MPSIAVVVLDGMVTATPKNITSDGVIILSAHKNGELTEMLTAEYNGSSEEFIVTADYDEIKVMLWNNLVGMKALAPLKRK